jgi:hypothetical protein
MTKMTDVYHLTLLPDTVEDAFMAFARQGFALAAVTRAGTITHQHLLKQHGDQHEPRRFLWIVHWTLHYELDVLEEIPRSLWKVAQRLDAMAETTAFARYVQQAEFVPV